MKIKFYLADCDGAACSNYQHLAVGIGEGLKALGLEFGANIDYWPEETGWLFRQVDFDEDVAIYTTFYLQTFDVDWSELKREGVHTVLLDREDGLFTSTFDGQSKIFDLILRTHYNAEIKPPDNVRPWAYGLTNRMIEALDRSRCELEALRAETLCTFRIAHSVRKWIMDRISKPLSHKYPVVYWFSSNSCEITQTELFNYTGGRHDPEYYERLNESLLAVGCGGVLALRPVVFSSWYESLMKVINKLMKHMPTYFGYGRNVIIYQQDSWRFWEIMYSNSTCITFEMSEQNWLLPVMPQNGTHYLGVGRQTWAKDINEIVGLDAEEILKVSKASQLWTLEHYSPKAQASRLISWLNELG